MGVEGNTTNKSKQWGKGAGGEENFGNLEKNLCNLESIFSQLTTLLCMLQGKGKAVQYNH